MKVIELQLIVTIPPMFNVQWWIIYVLGTYLLGAVPFGFLIAKAKGKDIRKLGSGNVGATNAGRVLGRKWGILCFVLDVGKGFGPVLAFGIATGQTSGSDLSAIHTLQWFAIAAAAVIGHVFPVYLKFKGGKGVATSLGAIVGLFPVLTIAAALVTLIWVATVKTTKYVSLGSIVAACLLPPLAAIFSISFGRAWGQIAVYVIITTVLGALVILRHKSNLARLRAGTENKVKW